MVTFINLTLTSKDRNILTTIVRDYCSPEEPLWIFNKTKENILEWLNGNAREMLVLSAHINFIARALTKELKYTNDKSIKVLSRRFNLMADKYYRH